MLFGKGSARTGFEVFFEGEGAVFISEGDVGLDYPRRVF
jgi:hypothetical protein